MRVQARAPVSKLIKKPILISEQYETLLAREL
ncbi:uncharacterized protein CPUR_00139 [Claviceps purpurea 20.1]|uniref:Uncharacterized protein n=1 Tax=Claviceps purpurea (strain 20.1) TaxID=1111077 RepID=M1W1C5_CLAP2|nr:uncharacterized protein CPUR_00139 [Claviceps purpurea 20.1]